MGTTLTGTTPQDTYDSLIKVTDNGPLSGTAKYLSDGLGNDSVLALSTASVGVGTTSPNIGTWNRALTLNTASGNAAYELAVAGAAQLYLAVDSTNAYLQVANASSPLSIYTGAAERMRITAAGNVGIGTAVSSWDGTFRALQIGLGTTIYNNSTVNGSFLGSNYFYNGTDNIYKNTGTATAYGQVNGVHSFFTATSGSAGNAVTFTEPVRIDANGIKFNGDTAAANALDDYEEGTWTMGVSFGGASVGVTTSSNTGTYTKVGRQVTAVGYIALSSKGSSTGQARVTGLPFTIANGSSFEAAAACRIAQITFADFIQINGNGNATTLDITEVTNAGVITTLNDADFANNSEIFVSITYFV